MTGAKLPLQQSGQIGQTIGASGENNTQQADNPADFDSTLMDARAQDMQEMAKGTPAAQSTGTTAEEDAQTAIEGGFSRNGVQERPVDAVSAPSQVAIKSAHAINSAVPSVADTQTMAANAGMGTADAGQSMASDSGMGATGQGAKPSIGDMIKSIDWASVGNKASSVLKGLGMLMENIGTGVTHSTVPTTMENEQAFARQQIAQRAAAEYAQRLSESQTAHELALNQYVQQQETSRAQAQIDADKAIAAQSAGVQTAGQKNQAQMSAAERETQLELAQLQYPFRLMSMGQSMGAPGVSVYPQVSPLAFGTQAPAMTPGPVVGSKATK